MKPLQWLQCDTGNMMSVGSRFRIQKPFPIKANTAGSVDVRGRMGPESRVILDDRIGGGKNEKGEAVPRSYLCLDVESAIALAEDVRAGKGVLTP